MKIYTDLEQSEVLSEILPIESADMYYSKDMEYPNLITKYDITNAKVLYDSYDIHYFKIFEYTPAWSLTALLDVLPYPKLEEDQLGSGKVGWAVSVYPNDCRYDSSWHSNPIDACYEMVLKLHKLNLL